MRGTTWIFLGLALASFPALAEPRWPDTFQGRLEALALVETLNADLLASDSATQTLEAWCAAHRMANDAMLHAHLIRGVQKPLPAAERARLEIGAAEPVVYRRVDLTCGDRVLSRADNWYVPSRLTAAMDKTLTTTDTPFGRVVHDLHPRRKTFAVTQLWHPLPQGWELGATQADRPDARLALPPVLFEHRAVVVAGNGKPISEVVEDYTGEILDFAHGR